jgi:hypothetical protein
MNDGYRVSLAVCLLTLTGVAHASGLEFHSVLSTAQEVPVPAAPSVTIEEAEVTIRFSEDFSSAAVRLEVSPSSSVVAAHFYCNLAGVNGPVAFGLISPGSFLFMGDVATGTLTNADYTGANCVPQIGRPVNNLAALALAMREGMIYANVHTSANMGGEFRGQLLPRDRDRDRDRGDEDDDEQDDGP